MGELAGGWGWEENGVKKKKKKKEKHDSYFLPDMEDRVLMQKKMTLVSEQCN